MSYLSYLTDKDIEILRLRQHLRILQRKQPRPSRIARWEKLTLLLLANKLTGMTGSALPTRYQLGDPYTTFAATFDTVFTPEDVTIIRTPVRAPNMNAFADRWLRTVREECLDKVLILGERYRQRMLTTYLDHYTYTRGHQGID